MDYQHHVFLSYSRRNTEAMIRLREIFVRSGLTVWTDERLEAGTPSWKNSIEGAILNAACIVVVLSPSAKASEWVERELDYGMALKKRIFPILVDGDAINAVPFELINVQYVDVRPDFELAVERTMRGIFSHLQLEQAPNELAVAKSTTQEIPVAEDWQEFEPARNWPKLLRQTRRLLSWYFFHPARLQRYRRLGGQDAVATLNSWVLASMMTLVLAIPTLCAFPAYFQRELPDWLIYLIALIFPMIVFLIGGLGTVSRSFSGFWRTMLLRWTVLFIACIGIATYYWCLDWFFPTTGG